MKSKGKAIIGIALVIAAVAALSVFFGINEGKIEDLYSKAATALVNDGEGMKELFLQEAVDGSKTLDADINAAAGFVKGKNVEIKDFKIYHESTSVFRAYGTIVTDENSYFMVISASGARLADACGIKQIIIEDKAQFTSKKIMSKKNYPEKFVKYLGHSKDYGITIRVPGDY